MAIGDVNLWGEDIGRTRVRNMVCNMCNCKGLVPSNEHEADWRYRCITIRDYGLIPPNSVQ